MRSAEPAHKPAVIVVEDEPVTRALLSGCLSAAGLAVTAFAGASGLAAHEALDAVDLFLLDIELPDGDGFALGEWLRARSEAGIIYLTRRADARDRVRGLDLGGDDYIVKPPDLDELLARVRAVLRRRRPHASLAVPADAPADAPLAFAGWRFDPRAFTLLAPTGAAAALTPGEASVLGLLAGAGGRAVSREALSQALAGEPGSNPRSLDVLVHRLRKKLGEGGNVAPRILLTVHGVGYRLGVEVTPAG